MRHQPTRSRRLQCSAIAALTLVLPAVAGTSAASAASTARHPTTAKTTLAQAQAAVAAAAGPVTWISPGPPLHVTAFRGKAIWVIVSDYSIPFLQAVVKGMQTAGRVAGVHVHVFDGQGVTQTAANGVEEAIGAHAAAIAIISVNFPYIHGAIEAANKAHIPVLGVLNTDVNQPLEKGAAAEVTLNYYKSGEDLVAYAVANTKGPVHAIFITFPSIATFTAMHAGILAGIRQYCPAGCTLRTDNVTEENFQSQTQSYVSEGIIKYPSTNWIFPAIDAMAQFAVPAVATVGAQTRVKVGSINGFAANLKFIQEHNVQAVDVGNSNPWLGWAVMDAAFRAISGAKPRAYQVPIRLLDAQNLVHVNVNSYSAPYPGTNYVARYMQLWGLSKA